MTQTSDLIKEIQSYMDEAMELCEQGAFIELGELNGRVKDICDAIQKLSPEEAQKHAGDLEKMMTSLDELQQIFESKRAALGDELNDTSKHQKAAKAYAQSDHAAPAATPEDSK